MRAYFAQFGSILHLRLSRNKKTGASKHYAFIQFASTTVADIVARTMNNYLMFGHILKVRLIPEEQVHPEMWKGANKRFKVVPRSMLERKEMERAKGREYWEGKVEKESKKRERKRKTMEALGYEYKAPELKKVDDMPMQDVEVEEELVKAKEDGAAEQEEEKEEEKMKAIVEVPAEVDEVQVEVEKIVKKGKKEKKETVKVKATKKVKV
jgi:nucleolar protein 15